MNRRHFLKDIAVGSGALLWGAELAMAAPDWTKQVGLELYTVRDLTAKDYEGTLAKVAEIGYKEVEPATDYDKLDPRQFRAMLDRYGLSAPSTHVPATDGPGLEKELEGFQVMGIKYTEIREAHPAPGGGPRRAPNRGIRQAHRRRDQPPRRDRQEVRHEDADPQPHHGVRAARREQTAALRRPARRDRPGPGRHATRYRLGLRGRTEHPRHVPQESRAASSCGTSRTPAASS